MMVYNMVIDTFFTAVENGQLHMHNFPSNK